MLGRFARVLILVAAAGVAYAGPIAACVCGPERMLEMPCCPGDTQPSQDSECPQADGAFDAVCDPVPADVLSPGAHDSLTPFAVSLALPSWPAHDPPTAPIATWPPPHDSPPIYLVTLRLRI